MVRPIGRDARNPEGCTGISNVAHVFGTGRSEHHLAQRALSHKQAEHLTASDQVRTLLRSWQVGGPSTSVTCIRRPDPAPRSPAGSRSSSTWAPTCHRSRPSSRTSSPR
jgi:hypothetical protein